MPTRPSWRQALTAKSCLFLSGLGQTYTPGCCWPRPVPSLQVSARLTMTVQFPVKDNGRQLCSSENVGES